MLIRGEGEGKPGVVLHLTSYDQVHLRLVNNNVKFNPLYLIGNLERFPFAYVYNPGVGGIVLLQ